MTAWNDLAALLDQAPGEYSVCVRRGRGETVYEYAAQVVRSAASLIKVPLALAVWDMLPQQLDVPVALREADRVAGEGAFDRAPAGTVRTVRQLIGHALRESDNTAANLLIDQLGFAAANQWLAEHGLQTRLQRKFMDYAALAAGHDNQTSAADMCVLLRMLLEPCYAELLALLHAAVGAEKLVAGLPPATPIAHKVGDLPGVEHDAGIIFAPNEPYIVAVLAVELPDTQAGQRVIAQAGRVIWEGMTGISAAPR